MLRYARLRYATLIFSPEKIDAPASFFRSAEKIEILFLIPSN